MTSEDVQALVDAEIGDNWSRSNLHHVDLRTSLVRPARPLMVTDVTGEQTIEVWLVLEEHPGGAGYAVVYSEADGAFGLVQMADGYDPCLLGIYGGFLDAFGAM
jgi:hypothetical protein